MTSSPHAYALAPRIVARRLRQACLVALIWAGEGASRRAAAQVPASLGEQPALRAPQGSEGGAPEAPPDAVVHYARGKQLYLEGRYGEAIVELKLALAFDASSPELHYNVARLHELLGEIDEAIVAYDRYRALIRDSDPQELARVDATLKRLRGARSELARDLAPPPPVTLSAPVSKRGVADGAFWTVGALGVGALLGAAGTGGYALWLDGRHADYVLGQNGTAADYEREATRLGRVALASDVLTIAGTTLTLSAILLYVLRTKQVEPVIRASADGGELWLGVRGRL